MKLSIFCFLPLFAIAVGTGLNAQSAFINEINYLASNPTGAGLEIAGEAGQSLDGWSVILYELDGTVATIEELEYQLIPSQQNGYGTIWYEMDQMSGGNGIALTNPSGTVVQFLGIGAAAITGITAQEGAAAGMTSTYAGTQLLPDQSLQLIGNGVELLDFSWSIPQTLTAGQINTNQFFGLSLPGLKARDNDQQWQQQAAVNQTHTSVYPNPATDFLRLEKHGAMEGVGGAIPVLLFDSNGRILRKAWLPADQLYLDIDLRELSSGTYYLRLGNAGSDQVHTVIKQ